MSTKTLLGTSALEFEIVDMRGKANFPPNDTGFVYRHKPDTYKKTFDTYLVRADAKGWRVDLQPFAGPPEAIYDEDRTSYWPSPEEAAKALEGALKRQNEKTYGVYTWE